MRNFTFRNALALGCLCIFALAISASASTLGPPDMTGATKAPPTNMMTFGNAPPAINLNNAEITGTTTDLAGLSGNRTTFAAKSHNVLPATQNVFTYEPCALKRDEAIEEMAQIKTAINSNRAGAVNRRAHLATTVMKSKTKMQV